MPFDFPAAPTDAQVVTFPEGPSYIYNALSTAWDRQASATTPPPIPPVVRPVITSASPEVIGLSDPMANTIVITGENFVATSQAYLGLNPMPTTFISATQVSFVVEPGQASFGTYGLTVGTEGLISMPPINFYVIPNPTIKTLIPPSATVAGGPVTVRLDGDHYEDQPYAATVIQLDGVDVPTTYNGSDNVTFNYTPTTPKTVQVQVHNGPVLADPAFPPVPFTVT